MLPSRTRSVLTSVIGLLAVLASGLVIFAASPAHAANTDIKINEVESSPPSGQVDWIELVNTGSAAVDVSGWILKDNDDTHHLPIAAGTVLQPGAHQAFDVDITGGFGLGSSDSARVFLPDGTTLVDTYTWTAHAGVTYGRCPDGTGSFINQVAGATRGTLNACGTATPNSAVKINEFTSNNPDTIELYNSGTGPVDLSNWVLKDSTDVNSYTFPVGSSIPAGAYRVINGEAVAGGFAFGLGNPDAVRLFDATATLIDSFAYGPHEPAGTSYGRCPNGTGAVTVTTGRTFGAANTCAAPTTVKINEFSSNSPDFIELVNTGTTSVDLSGWVLKDNTDVNSYTFPSGSSIGVGEHKLINGESVDFVFGLGNGDAVRLYWAGDLTNPVDSYTYPAHPPAGKSYSRCPDGTGDFVTSALITKGAVNDCSTGPAVPDVKINEVESNGDAVGDWVELRNNTSGSVDVSGWKILDNDPTHVATPDIIPANTSIPAGGYYSLYTEFGQNPGFGLGGADSATLLLPDGTTQVDTYSWTAHAATTYGRCPDGSGAFTTTITPTRNGPNACSSVVINEVESDQGVPGDWVELKNVGSTDVNIGGWVFKDNVDADNYTIPAGTTIAAGGYKVLDVADFVFGLGSADSARLYNASATLVDSYSWTAHATTTYGRCPDGVGAFATTTASTKGAANSCPGLTTLPWPGSPTVSYADNVDTFVQDLSGLAFDPNNPDVLWGAQNKKGTLFKLLRDANNNWVPAPGWPRDPKFADGNGAPDTEGITVTPDGSVYMTSERDNDNSGTSRNTILRFDPNSPAGATIVPNTEWDLNALIPATGANLGLEGITFVPDTYLVGNGFKDQSTGAAYNPATYPLHGNGLFIVAVEQTGNLVAFALDSNGTAHKVATVDSGFTALADVDFDPELGRVRAVTDDTFGGKTSLLKIDASGNFVVDKAYDRPAGMPNLNNEGLAIAPQSRCVNGLKEVLWSDDGDDDGHSIRRGAINCTVPDQPQNVAITSIPPMGAVVGQTYDVTATGGGSSNPVVLSIGVLTTDKCSLTGSTVHFDHPGTCTIQANQAAAPHFLAGQATQDLVIGKASQTLTFTQPGDTVYGGAGVPLVASSDAGLPVTLTSETPAVCSVAGTTATPLTAGTCTVTASQGGDGDHLDATPVSRSLTVAKAAQTITFTQPGNATYGGANVPLGATSDAGLPVTFVSQTPAVCSIVGSSAKPLTAGTCTVTAQAPGDANHLDASSVDRSLTVGKAAQTITFAQPGGTVFGGADVALSASSDAGLPVSFVSQTPGVCSVVGSSAKPLAAGTCTITAQQAGDANHVAASPVSRSLTVAKAPVVVTTKSTSGLASLLTLKITYTSTVKSAVTGLPVAGVPVTTRVNGGSPTSGCTAITNASGVATCTVGPISIALGVTYTASAAETANFLAGSGTAFIGLL